MEKLRENLMAKIGAFFLLAIMSIVFIGSCTGIIYMACMNVYLDGGEKAFKSAISDEVAESTFRASNYYIDYYNKNINKMENYKESFSKRNSNYFFEVKDKNGKKLLGNYFEVFRFKISDGEEHILTLSTENKKEVKTFRSEKERDEYIGMYMEKYKEKYTNLQYQRVSGKNGDGKYILKLTYDKEKKQHVYITGYIRSNLEAKDNYYYINYWMEKLVGLRYALIFISICALICCIIILVFLLYSAGHKRGVEGIHMNWIDKIPLDLYTAILTIFFGISFYAECVLFGLTMEMLIISVIVLPGWFIMGMSFVMTFATRAKNGTLWKNTILYRIFLKMKKLIWWLGCETSFVHMLWKAAVIYFGLSFVELIYVGLGGDDYMGWLLKKILLIPIILFTVINMQRLGKGAEEIAKGNLNYKIDTAHLFLGFKTHGENLNSINTGMQKAVEQRLKSERFKTELITNVSHDIKTPLTSIINYVDLIKKEDIGSETAKEYVEVLDRQSGRLKRLTEDLVEASKAATGNIAVKMERTDVNVLLSQAAGEYEERLKECGLELILTTALESSEFSADGRLMWRVFDNLISNICKYAKRGTRVYLTSEVKDNKVFITFRNISDFVLNIPSEDLMERFVRGDVARNTEGSGLGLSIAKSLIELQQGKLEIIIDGDLFKVVVEFLEL